jgi:hypothetical protein
VSDNSSPDEINRIEVLDQLIKRVWNAHDTVQDAERLTLDSALDAGDALLDIRDRITGTMKNFMAKNLPKIGVSTWKLYMWLADNRAVIDAAREQNPHLSINAARKLITRPADTGNKPSTSPAGIAAELEVVVPIISDEHLIAALASRGPDWMLENMPGWRAWLVAKLRGVILRDEQIKHPETKVKNLRIPSTRHLKLVHPTEPTTTQH